MDPSKRTKEALLGELARCCLCRVAEERDGTRRIPDGAHGVDAWPSETAHGDVLSGVDIDVLSIQQERGAE
jgi:hypothetical protein